MRLWVGARRTTIHTNTGRRHTRSLGGWQVKHRSMVLGKLKVHRLASQTRRLDSSFCGFHLTTDTPALSWMEQSIYGKSRLVDQTLEYNSFDNWADWVPDHVGVHTKTRRQHRMDHLAPSSNPGKKNIIIVNTLIQGLSERATALFALLLPSLYNYIQTRSKRTLVLRVQHKRKQKPGKLGSYCAMNERNPKQGN